MIGEKVLNSRLKFLHDSSCVIFATVDGLLAVDSGKRILLDGCFDPVHHGHIRYIRAARQAFPDWRIVVAVAADSEIRRKGREPLFGQLTRCAIVDGLAGVDVVIAKDRPTHEIISALKPGAFVKGKDWEGKLSPEIQAACALHDAQIVYLGDTLDSSTDRLRTWARYDADASLDRLEAFMAEQSPASEPWQPVTDYSFEARKAIEAKHPELIKEVFQPECVMDAGCGPGHLVRLLRVLGVEAYGFDRNPPDGDWFAYGDLCSEWVAHCGSPIHVSDLVVNREVMEHLTVRQIHQAVTNLCRLSSRFVYGTTRFNPSPRHVLDFATEFDVDPTHISCGTHWFLRLLFSLEGFKWRGDLAKRMDWMGKGRAFVFERVS